jgi:hypothetical protein
MMFIFIESGLVEGGGRNGCVDSPEAIENGTKATYSIGTYKHLVAGFFNWLIPAKVLFKRRSA